MLCHDATSQVNPKTTRRLAWDDWLKYYKQCTLLWTIRGDLKGLCAHYCKLKLWKEESEIGIWRCEIILLVFISATDSIWLVCKSMPFDDSYSDVSESGHAEKSSWTQRDLMRFSHLILLHGASVRCCTLLRMQISGRLRMLKCYFLHCYKELKRTTMRQSGFNMVQLSTSSRWGQMLKQRHLHINTLLALLLPPHFPCAEDNSTVWWRPQQVRSRSYIPKRRVF